VKLLRIACLIAGATGSLSSYSPGSWPDITDVRGERTYVDTGKGGDTPFLLVVKDRAGIPAYRLDCHNGDYDDDSEFNFSGDFHCALFAMDGDKTTSPNLLSSDEESKIGRDWFNRGRMIGNQLKGLCGEYSEYGVLRHFRLRGMLVTFHFGDLHWFPFAQFNRNRLSKFTFTVSFVGERSATSASAEAVEVPRPPRSCDW